MSAFPALQSLPVAAAPRRGSGRAVFAARVHRDVAGALDVWKDAAGSGAATPFQHPLWLTTWYREVAPARGAEPLVVEITGAGGVLALLLPLIRRREGARTVIAFADLGITDYNAPLLGPAAPSDRAGAEALWRALKAALPPCDTIALDKMPAEIGGRANPLALLSVARPMKLVGNVLAVTGPWEGYRRSLERTFRKEIERSWRVFTRHPDAEFRSITDPAEAQTLLRRLEEQQRARIRELGLPYILDDPAFTAFYRRLLADGLDSGYASLTVLMAGGEMVAGLLGIRDRDSYAMVRLSTAGEAWKTVSPGRLMIERSMAHWHGHGTTMFDFTIGDYAYKRRMGVVPVPLVEIESACSWRGLPRWARGAAAERLRRHPRFVTFLKRLRGDATT